jgi:hypothetical protein
MIYNLTRKNNGYMKSPEMSIYMSRLWITLRASANLFQNQHTSVHVPDMNDHKEVRRDIQN